MFGIGVSPGTGSEVRFVLRVMERVSIPSHRHSGLPMMELGFVVFICAFILHWLAHFAPSAIMYRDAWLVARGSRHADICENTLLCPFPAVCCSKSRISGLPRLGTHFKNRCKQRLIRAASWISAQRQPGHASFFIRNVIKAVPGLHASLFIFLVNLLINYEFVYY